MIVIRNFRVTGSTCTQLNLCASKPFYVFEESLVLDVPHKTQRPKHTPTMICTEAGRSIRTCSNFRIIQIFIVVLPTEEKRQIRIGTITIRPRCSASSGKQVGEAIVILPLCRYLESGGLIIYPFLSQQKIE